MTQYRIWNFGDTFTSAKAIALTAALNSPGVYSGYDVTIVDSDEFTLSPGSLLLPSGILVQEDIPLSFVLSPIPAGPPANFTVVIRHTDSNLIGGQAAVYSMEPGLLLPGDVPNGIPIVYLKHPGGGQALDPSFFVPVLKQSSASSDSPQLIPTTFLAPFTSKWVLGAPLEPNTTVSDTYIAPSAVTQITTGGGGPVFPLFEETFVVLPLVAGKFRPLSIVIGSSVDPNSLIAISLRDTDGNLVVTSPATLGLAPVIIDRTITIAPDSGVFTEGDIYSLELKFRTSQLTTITLKSIKFNYNPLP